MYVPGSRAASRRAVLCVLGLRNRTTPLLSLIDRFLVLRIAKLEKSHNAFAEPDRSLPGASHCKADLGVVNLH
jgi:hypothetical protein